MRQLSAPMAARLAATGLDATWLLEIQWPDGSIGRYADRTVQVDAETYTGAIAEWRPFEIGERGTPAGARSVELLARAGSPLWADLHGRDVAGAAVRVGYYALGTGAADVVWLLGGDLASVHNDGSGLSRLELRSLLATLPATLPPHHVDVAGFPNAAPESVGRVLPLVYGAVPHVPAVPVLVAPLTRLRGSVAASSLQFEVEDTAGPPAFPSGPLTLRVDDEYLAGSFSANTFAVTARGVDAVASATAATGTATSLADPARTEPDAAWVGFILAMTGGTPANIGVERVITGFDAATRTLSVTYPFFAAIAPGDTYRITTRAADHLHGAVVELVGADHVFLVADHPCAAVADVRLDGEQLAPADFRINRNDTTTFPGLGRAVTTITTRGRPRVKRFAAGSRFLLARFDADGGSSPGVAWGNAIDPRPTFVAQLNATQPALALKQTTDMTDGPARYGTLRGAFLVVQFRQDRLWNDDAVDIEWNGQPLGTLDPTQAIDHAGGGGEVDLVHTHPQDLSHPVAPIARTHEHMLPGQVRQVDTDTVTGNGFSSTNPKTLNRSSTPPHATDETIQATVARFTTTITSSPSGFNPVGVFRLHYHLPYGPWLTRDSFNGEVTLNGTNDITAFLNQWANWPATLNRFQFWVENVAASQISVENFAGLWEVTVAPRLSESSTTFLETETTDLPAVTLDGVMAPVQNEEDPLSVVYENLFDLRPFLGADWAALNDATATARYVVNGSNDGVQVYIASMRIDVEYAPFAYSTEGALTATVSGVEDQGDGGGTVVTNPADVLRDLLTVRLGLDPGRLDGGAFTQAAVEAAAAGARFDFALTVPGAAPAVAERMAHEAHGLLTDAGGIVSFRIPPDADSAPTGILRDATRANSAAPVTRRGLETVANAHTLFYAEDYRPDSTPDIPFARSVSAEDAASVATYQRRSATTTLRYVRDDAWAAALAATHVAEAAWPRLRCAWPAHWHHLGVERGDVVWLTDPGLGLVDAPGRVVAERYVPGSWRERRLDASGYDVELAPWRIVRAFAADTWLVWSRDGLRYVIGGATVARVTLAGDWWIAGRYIRHATLAPGSVTEFESYDGTARTVYYSDPAGARLLEIRDTGDVRIAGAEEINAPLGTAPGPEGTGRVGGTVQWLRGGVAPAYALLATLTTLRWRLAGRILQNGVFPNT